MQYIIDHIPADSPKRPGNILRPKYLTAHNTGNPGSTARGERNWLTNPDNTSTTGYHIVIDDRVAVECIPLTENAWHAGDGSKGPGNRESIGIEICESGDRERTLINAAKVFSGLLQQFDLDFTGIKQHFDWSGKDCPRLMRGKGYFNYVRFIVMIDRMLSGDKR